MKSTNRKLKSDPPLAKPEYTSQTVHVYKPSSLDMWLSSPKHYGYPWNLIRMWLPEAVTALDANNKQIWQWRHVFGKNLWKKKNKVLKSTEHIDDHAVMTLTTNWHDDQVEFEVKLKNVSSQAWSRIEVHSCLQMSAAPDYSDNTGERTYLIVDGDFTPTSLLDITDPGMRGQGIIDTELPMKDGTKKKVTDGVYFVVSKDKKYILAYSWQPPKGFFYNRAGIVSCIHVNPKIENVEPQNEALAKGILFITEGSLEDAYTCYKKWQSSLKT